MGSLKGCLQGSVTLVYVLFFMYSISSTVTALDVDRVRSIRRARNNRPQVVPKRQEKNLNVFEIPFQISDTEEGRYYFNCGIGSPPQIVNMTIQLTRGDSQISNITIEDSAGNKRYNQSASTSSKSNVLATKYDLSMNLLNTVGSNPLKVQSVDIEYSSDDLLMNGAQVTGMSFVSWSNSSYEDSILEGFELGDLYPSYWLGLGAPTAKSVSQSGQTQEKSAPTFTQQLKTQNLTASNAYSIWLDPASQNTGHLLIGAINPKRYKDKLVDLLTSQTLTSDHWGLLTQSQLTASLSSLSINMGAIKIPIVGTVRGIALSHAPATILPLSTARQIWDSIRANYTSNANPKQIQPTVPCSLLSEPNNFLNLQFNGAPDLILSIPLPNLIAKSTNASTTCNLLVLAGQQDSEYFLSSGALRDLYTVNDYENNIISIALTDRSPTTSPSPQPDILVPIPVTGISSIPSSAFKSPQRESSSKGTAIGLGITIPILFLLACVGIYSILRTRKVRAQARQYAIAKERSMRSAPSTPITPPKPVVLPTITALSRPVITSPRPEIPPKPNVPPKPASFPMDVTSSSSAKRSVDGRFSVREPIHGRVSVREQSVKNEILHMENVEREDAESERIASAERAEDEESRIEFLRWRRLEILQRELDVCAPVIRRGDILPIARGFETRHELP